MTAHETACGKTRRLAVDQHVVGLGRQFKAVVAAIEQHPAGGLQPQPLQQPARVQSGFCGEVFRRQRTGTGHRLEQPQLVTDKNHCGDGFPIPVLPDHVCVVPRRI